MSDELRPRPMRTLFGVRLGFELRRLSFGRYSKNRKWIVAFRSAHGRAATPEEIRMWKSLPNRMTAIQAKK